MWNQRSFTKPTVDTPPVKVTRNKTKMLTNIYLRVNERVLIYIWLRSSNIQVYIYFELFYIISKRDSYIFGNKIQHTIYSK